MSLVTILPASLRRSITALLALGLVGVAGCNADTTGQGPVAPGEAPAAAHARPFGMKGRGPAGMLVEKAASLDLKPEQKATVEAIRTRIQEPSPAVREAHDALHTALVSQVRAGAIDEAKLQPLVAKVDEAMANERAATQKALNDLHRALSPEQRKALIASMRDHAPGMGHPHGERPRGERGDHGRGDHPRGDHAFGGKHGGPGAHLDRMAEDLGLSAEQKATIQAKLAEGPKDRQGPPREGRRADHEQMRARMKAFGEAFESDTFDAASFEPPMMKERAGHHIHLLAAVVPVLDASQRTVLADQMEAHHKPMGAPPKAK